MRSNPAPACLCATPSDQRFCSDESSRSDQRFRSDPALQRRVWLFTAELDRFKTVRACSLTLERRTQPLLVFQVASRSIDPILDSKWLTHFHMVSELCCSWASYGLRVSALRPRKRSARIVLIRTYPLLVTSRMDWLVLLGGPVRLHRFLNFSWSQWKRRATLR